MSAECHDCGADITYPPGTWPLGECEPCKLRAENERLLSLVAQPELRELLEHRKQFSGEWDVRVNGALERLIERSR